MVSLTVSERELLLSDVIDSLAEGKSSATEVAFDLLYNQSGVLERAADELRMKYGGENTYINICISLYCCVMVSCSRSPHAAAH